MSVLLAASAAVAGPAAAATPATAAWTAATPAAGPGQWVTLITGDRVHLSGANVAIEPAAGRESVGFSQYTEDGRQFVVPNDALRMVSAGEADRRLFDITGLVQAGYGDTAAAELPLIIGYADAATGAAKVRAAGQPRVTRTLGSVRGAAVRVGKARATAFWSGLTTGPGTQRRPVSGVAKIWLDGKRELSLDASVPQIGAPAAWQAGYDGAGVTVAVLDTGIDATHPDFAGKIVEARNFTDAADTDDTLGHGTHVASTVVGSGAKSGGRYRGVAPGASLLVGKVCPDRSCPESAILAGLEWAAPRAKVINLSLGGPDTAGDDPLEAAVNRLTAQTGVLVVAAAGNDGRDTYVGSPATADAALAVGAVDKQDNLASFSNRGPRLDGAVKPDVSAPGVGIVAALAKNSAYPTYEPGYTQLNGTSMATPHVTGAAALLAQQHPEWTAGELKAALMASAKPNPAIGTYGQGAGRIDVARAIGQAVLPSPTSLALGAQPWPADDDVPVTKTVTYRNAGPAAVTLDVAASATAPDGTPAPAGMFTATPSQVTVAAGGTAQVTLAADTRVPSATGLFNGALVAAGGSGVAVRVPFTVGKGHESRRLTVHLIDRDGAPATNYALNLVGVDFQVFQSPYHASGTLTANLRAGRYHVQATVITPSDGSSTLLTLPVLTVGGDDGVLTLDARRGTPVSVTVPDASARTRWSSAGFFRALPSGYGLTTRITNSSLGKLFTADLGGTVPAGAGALTAEVRAFFADPGADGTFFDSPYEYDLVWFQRGRFLTDFSRTVKRKDLAAVTQRYHAVASGVRTGLMQNFGFPPEGGSALSGPLRFTVPGVRTVYYTADDVVWQNNMWQLNALGQAEQQEWGRSVTYRPGRRYVAEWQEGVTGPRFPNRTFLWRQGNTIAFNLPPFGDQAGNTGYSLLDTGRMAFYRDGQKLVEIPRYFYDARGAVPPAESEYRLEYETTRGGAAGFENGTAVSGSWTFRSSEVGADAPTYLPLAAFDFRPELNLDNAAPGVVAFPLPVRLQRQPGSAAPAVRRITVEVSYDDGASWRPVRLRRDGADSWRGTLRHPASGYVSLRGQAAFADGSTAQLTVLHAYRLAPGHYGR
ncbi:S8 family peptidase [Phytohabitans rumicis]|uniref:Serine protease n=1 Tax=Phytohabitans rumicis TaxID=1076125 RepID=A0A6V8KXQ0_9ACTN|nr:S8 family serine peptidase [Phytohabitans rumicis]GFJ86617.1 serine protease [Phytohabitans rumicis]